MKDRYGSLGDTFIHVHHIQPLSEAGAERDVDPINDLINDLRPVCPNCHSMLHSRKLVRPVSIDELKCVIEQTKSKKC